MYTTKEEIEAEVAKYPELKDFYAEYLKRTDEINVVLKDYDQLAEGFK